MPPEALKPNPDYSTKLDVFSFGCVTIHTVTQEYPIPGNKYIETSEQGKYKELSEIDRRLKLINTFKNNLDSGTLLYDIVLECLQNDPQKRPAMAEACKKLKECFFLKHAMHSKLQDNKGSEQLADKSAATVAHLKQEQQLQSIFESQHLNYMSHLFKST